MFSKKRLDFHGASNRALADPAPIAALAVPKGLWAIACLTLACGEGGPGVEGTDYAIYEFGVGFQQLCYVVLFEERRAAVEQAVLWDYGPLVEECDPRIPEDADEQ